MRRGQIEKIRQERRTEDTPARPLAMVICKHDPAVSRAGESTSGIDAYVRSNTSLGHNPNLR